MLIAIILLFLFVAALVLCLIDFVWLLCRFALLFVCGALVFVLFVCFDCMRLLFVYGGLFWLCCLFDLLFAVALLLWVFVVLRLFTSFLFILDCLVLVYIWFYALWFAVVLPLVICSVFPVILVFRFCCFDLFNVVWQLFVFWCFAVLL